jgi:hypothetical protein
MMTVIKDIPFEECKRCVLSVSSSIDEEKEKGGW